MNVVEQLFASYDRTSEQFGALFPAANAAVAARAFSDAVLSSQPSDLSQHPDDFELYHIGEFDHSTGRVSSVGSKLGKPIITGTQVKATKPPKSA